MSERNRKPLQAALWSSRLLLMVMLAATLVFAAFLTILTGSWWFLLVALAVHLAATAWVVTGTLDMLGDVDAPSPTERAALESRGVLDPDRELNERHNGGSSRRVRRLLREDGGEARTAEEQQSAWTPAASRRVGSE